MTPQARAQAAIEILDLVIAAAREDGAAADTLIATWFRTRRFAGSKDRRAVRDLVYRAIRHYGQPPASGRAALLGLGDDMAALFDGSTYGPAPRAVGEAGAPPSPLAPWLEAQLDPAERAALDGRAALDVRVNWLKVQRADVLAAFPDATPIGRDGVRLAENSPIEQHPAYVKGWIDIQDAGSQLIAQLCNAQPGMNIVDLCAGAGGKALALAADMHNQGRIVASDTNRDRLSRLAPRAERLGVDTIITRLLDPGYEPEMLRDLNERADVVLIDAPCSGSGTWRRNPEARWRISPKKLEAVVAAQARLLSIGAALVRPGGMLVYATCSLLDVEGPAQIDSFLGTHQGWTPDPIHADIGAKCGHGWRVSPARDGCDGFFVARLARQGHDGAAT